MCVCVCVCVCVLLEAVDGGVEEGGVRKVELDEGPGNITQMAALAGREDGINNGEEVGDEVCVNFGGECVGIGEFGAAVEDGADVDVVAGVGVGEEEAEHFFGAGLGVEDGFLHLLGFFFGGLPAFEGAGVGGGGGAAFDGTDGGGGRGVCVCVCVLLLLVMGSVKQRGSEFPPGGGGRGGV